MKRTSTSSVLGLSLLALLVASGCRQESWKVAPPGIEPASWPALVEPSPDSAQLYRDNRHLFDYDREAPLGLVELGRHREGELTLFDLTFESPRGGEVPATLIEPPPPGPFAGVVLQHGSPSSRKDQIWLGKIYARMGAVVVLIDAPFARPERASSRPVTLTPQDRDEQIQQIVDLRRAVDLLESRGNVDTGRLAYVGVSHGAAMGGLLAGVEDRLRAYVLAKGDGGLVEHLAFDRGGGRSALGTLDEESRKAWVDAMWPIEPIHFVAHAGPAALLFQNGTRDSQVPPRLALAYQNAGSEPKTVLWYRSGHALPFDHVVDELEWLRDRIGIRDVDRLPRTRLLLMGPAESFVRLNPEIRTSALAMDRTMLLWFLLVAASVVLVVRGRRAGGETRARGVTASWLLATAYFGPLGLLVRRALGKRNASEGSPPPSPALRAMGSSLWTVAARMTGLIAAIAVLDRQRQLYDSPLVVLLLVWGFPFVLGWGMHGLARWSREGGSGTATVFRRTLSAHLISNHLVIALALPTAGFLVSRWLYRWYPLPGWQVASAPFWAIAALAAFAAGVVCYPVELWLLRWGRVEWGLGPRSGSLDRSGLQRLAVGSAIVASLLAMLAGFHLTFGYLL